MSIGRPAFTRVNRMKPTDDHSIRTAVRGHYESVVKESEAKKSQVNCCAPSCCGADEASSKMGYSPEEISCAKVLISDLVAAIPKPSLH